MSFWLTKPVPVQPGLASGLPRRNAGPTIDWVARTPGLASRTLLAGEGGRASFRGVGGEANPSGLAAAQLHQFGRVLQLTAGSKDVAAPGTPNERRNARSV